jgi:hypothetical protein
MWIAEAMVRWRHLSFTAKEVGAPGKPVGQCSVVVGAAAGITGESRRSIGTRSSPARRRRELERLRNRAQSARRWMRR